MEIAVLDIKGKEIGRKVTLSDAVFGIEPNEHAVYLDVKQHLANKRQGTHKAKERAEIAGSTRKIKKQKGTGTARAGSIKSPVFRGGGRIFGPRPRNYSFKLNKKQKQLARRSALSQKAQDNAIVIVDEFQNLNFHELDSIITRVGENTRICFCGDSRQSDLNKANERNGIVDFMNILRKMPSFDIIEFGTDDIVRSGLVKEYIVAKIEAGF